MKKPLDVDVEDEDAELLEEELLEEEVDEADDDEEELEELVPEALVVVVLDVVLVVVPVEELELEEELEEELDEDDPEEVEVLVDDEREAGSRLMFSSQALIPLKLSRASPRAIKVGAESSSSAESRLRFLSKLLLLVVRWSLAAVTSCAGRLATVPGDDARGTLLHLACCKRGTARSGGVLQQLNCTSARRRRKH